MLKLKLPQILSPIYHELYTIDGQWCFYGEDSKINFNAVRTKHNEIQIYEVQMDKTKTLIATVSPTALLCGYVVINNQNTLQSFTFDGGLTPALVSKCTVSHDYVVNSDEKIWMRYNYVTKQMEISDHADPKKWIEFRNIDSNDQKRHYNVYQHTLQSVKLTAPRREFHHAGQLHNLSGPSVEFDDPETDDLFYNYNNHQMTQPTFPGNDSWYVFIQ